MFLDEIINRFILIFCPWKFPVKIRIILSNLFFSENKFYTRQDSIENIIESKKVTTNYFKNGKAFYNRYALLRHCARIVKNTEFSAAEFGVYKGDSLRCIANNVGKKKCYGFDSFEGLPEAWGNLLPKYYFKTAIPSFTNKNIELQVGKFQESLPLFLRDNPDLNFDLLHIDCDLYSSTCYVLENLFSKITNKSIIIFDEFYGYKGFKKFEFQSFNEFIKKYDIRLYWLLKS